MVHEQRPIPILFSSDDAGVAPPLLVAIGSLLAHAGPGTVYHVYLLTNAVSEENLGRVRALFPEQGPHRFFPLEVSERLHRCVDALPSVGWPIAVWARFFAAEWFPALTGKVIYLDIDVLVCEDLTPLFEVDLQGRTLAAVCECHRDDDIGQRIFANTPMPAGAERYFNTGVLVLDMDAFRSRDVLSRLVAFAARPGFFPMYPDQDTLNAVLWDDVVFLHPRWNVRDRWLTRAARRSLALPHWRGLSPVEVLEAIRNPGVIHYSGHNKPWKANHRPEGPRYAATMRALGLLGRHFPGETLLVRLRNCPFPVWYALLRAYCGLRLAVLKSRLQGNNR